LTWKVIVYLYRGERGRRGTPGGTERKGAQNGGGKGKGVMSDERDG